MGCFELLRTSRCRKSSKNWTRVFLFYRKFPFTKGTSLTLKDCSQRRRHLFVSAEQTWLVCHTFPGHPLITQPLFLISAKDGRGAQALAPLGCAGVHTLLVGFLSLPCLPVRLIGSARDPGWTEDGPPCSVWEFPSLRCISSALTIRSSVQNGTGTSCCTPLARGFERLKKGVFTFWIL